jgi:hypothetical protein
MADRIPRRGGTAAVWEASAFLCQVATAEIRTFPGIGMGETTRLQSTGIVGAGLIVEGRLVHLAAFRTEGNKSAGDHFTGSRLNRASRRFR